MDETSATLLVPDEVTIPVECSHAEICRFSGAGRRYKAVSGAVIELVEQICPIPST